MFERYDITSGDDMLQAAKQVEQYRLAQREKVVAIAR